MPPVVTQMNAVSGWMVVAIADDHEFVVIVFGAATESGVAAAVGCSPVVGLVIRR